MQVIDEEDEDYYRFGADHAKERAIFLKKKVNKLKKDQKYGTMAELQNKIRRKDYGVQVSKLKQAQ
eukprot:CAMPEP_0116878212 /NCGR_PEP_ID=MMETSP0463-20121206/9943_1 /TAXON_ID=181622 /ORGANISM="Strombidinopsis sp, Strain SopsisLIS2011" /LENGTH=65 /DNA_ID=CAMNT_0004526169 /DNA_START=294 /DNA_END=491 /DNA_ORIENTATION=-